jgi:hypothetical protein
MLAMSEPDERLKLLEAEIERRLVERFAALRDEFDRLRVESDRRWAGFLERFEQKFTGIVPPELLAPPPSAAAPGTAAPRGGLSIDAARRLDDAGNQIEILNRFLEISRTHASRAALLVLKGGNLGVWKAVGFSEHGGSDEKSRATTFSMGDGSPLSDVLEGNGRALGEGNPISAALGAKDATRAILVPMAVKEKISGALYADGAPGEESRFDPDALSVLTFVAGLAVDRLALRKLTPAPALRGLAAASASAEPAMELEVETPEAAPPPPAPESRFKTQMMPAVEPGAKPSPPPSYGAPPTAEALPEAASSWPGLDEASPRGAAPTLPRESMSAAAAAPERISGVTPMPAPEARPSVSMPRPSTGARRLAGPLAPVEGDERRDEARRFAKLLVSEIKLYNEKQVQEGRQHGNLYELLKEDIDRSRQMYDERIPEDVRANSNFFYEELVRVLADGKAETLGI